MAGKGKRYTPEELQKILRLHALWLDGKVDFDQQVNLRDADLGSHDLRGVNLRRAYMVKANLVTVHPSTDRREGIGMLAR